MAGKFQNLGLANEEAHKIKADTKKLFLGYLQEKWALIGLPKRWRCKTSTICIFLSLAGIKDGAREMSAGTRSGASRTNC
jgi:hypothetical protein